MNKIVKSAGTSLVLALILAQSAHATPTNINDDYMGGNDNGWGDVIGNKTYFDILSMDVERVGNSLSVSVNTNFAGRTGQLFTGLSYGKGIAYGDLFLNDSWNPYPEGGAPYQYDNASNGTDWSYAFSLDDRWTNGGTGSLYELNGDNSDILMSDDFLSGGTFRNGQEVAVNRGDKPAIASDIAWDVTAGKVNFLIDLTGTSLEFSDTIALRWEITCANDAIEGQYTSVPEPAMIGLLALGLIGMGLSQRRKN